MRSERLLDIVTALQRRVRVTAPELAEEFDVSVKTIQRDIEALSRAGVPVFSSRGKGGGWQLLPDYRSSMTGLTSVEALAIVVGRPQGLLGDLGFEESADRAIGKLLGGLPTGDRERARRARDRLLIDRDLWSFAAEPEPFLAVLFRAVCDDIVVRLRYTDAATRFEVAPFGLVFKRNAWYLFATRRGEHRTYRVARIRELSVTSKQFDRPASFNLAKQWQESTKNYAASLPSYGVELRLRGDALARVSALPVRRRLVGEADRDGWTSARLDFLNEIDALESIRRLGAGVQVVSPGELRLAAVADARAFLDDNT